MHHRLQLLPAHLPMSHTTLNTGNQTMNHILNIPDIIHPVMDKKHLSSTAHLVRNRILNHFLIKTMQLRHNRVTIRRGRTDNRHIPRPHQRKLQRPRDRCRRHGNGIHIQFQTFQLLLHRHPKLLLLINHQQTEVLKFYIIACQTMRSDDNIHLPRFQIFQNPLNISTFFHPADILDPARHPLQTFLESIIMLISQNRRRH